MKRALDRAFDPPAPMLEVSVRHPSGGQLARVLAKIDTGSDVCAVSEALVAELDLPPYRSVRAAGFAGTLHEILLYRVDLVLSDELAFARVEALATKRPYAIVGRNVLRHLVLRIDGPAEQLELRRASRSPRSVEPASHGKRRRS